MSTAAPDVALDHVDLMDADLFGNGPPHELFARMRAEAPVLHCTTAEEALTVVTKAPDISAISKRPDVFSSRAQGRVHPRGHADAA